ncbi:hypothetical protein PAXRUDRAFT_520858 [Paxillus rubicundulus Ve08.2h10]|uniref:Uncharacterized protein n=1 Tax=Paxillus rubicundulus Ve08.2h10 TaxID=930991 RepID=A0A0D0DC37_9AGAM|nr:hypothetical protein PAXRUDRAFT_520858 [Paxillus rubicundulus Ve08.2h10]
MATPNLAGQPNRQAPHTFTPPDEACTTTTTPTSRGQEVPPTGAHPHQPSSQESTTSASFHFGVELRGGEGLYNRMVDWSEKM